MTGYNVLSLGKGRKYDGMTSLANKVSCHDAHHHRTQVGNMTPDTCKAAAKGDLLREEACVARKGKITPQEAEKRLQRLCAGFWSDSDNEAESSLGNHDTAVSSSCTAFTLHRLDQIPELNISEIFNSVGNIGCKRSVPSHDSSNVPNHEYPSLKHVPNNPCSSVKTLASHADKGRGENKNIGNRELSKRSKKAQGLRRWEALVLRRPRRSREQLSSEKEAGDAPFLPQKQRKLSYEPGAAASLEDIKKLGGIGSSARFTPLRQEPEEGRALQAEAFQAETGKKVEEDHRKVFDETVQDMRKLGSFKGQRMPLPEFRCRAAATASAVRARKAEERELGVELFKDKAGGEARARSLRRDKMKAKERRAHLRQTFKDAGKISHHAASSLRRKKNSKP